MSTTQTAIDLSAIESLYEQLLAQAIHRASSKLMPGGEAMVALGKVGSPELWEEQIAAEEFRHLATCPKYDHTRCRFADHVADDDQGGEPPLQTLLFWSEPWRVILGYPRTSDRSTIATEVTFIRWALNWAADNEPNFGAFSRDVAAARTRLENLLYAGERAERGVPCLYDECRGARLVRKLVPTGDGKGGKTWKHSDWHCPKCKRQWDEAAYARHVTAAHERTKFEDIAGQTWCSIDYAARNVDRSVKVIERWVRDGEVATICIVAGKRTRFVDLSAVIERDLTTPRRNRAA